MSAPAFGDRVQADPVTYESFAGSDFVVWRPRRADGS